MFDSPLIENPYVIFVYFTGVVGAIFWLSSQRATKGFFKYLPPLIWCYFIPMIGTTLNITPASSELYGFLRTSLLPFLLLLLLLATDVKSILKLGPRALGTMLFGSLGIVIGAAVAFFLFGGSLPEDSWKGVAALSGSWIGGSANMAAVAESIGATPDQYAPLIVVDTVVGYSWLGILLFLGAYQDKIDRWNKANTAVLHEIADQIRAENESKRRPMQFTDLTAILAIGFVVSTVCMAAGNGLYNLMGDVIAPELMIKIGQVLSGFTLGIFILTVAGVALSLTKMRDLEFAGAGHIGYVSLYILIASIGAQADLGAVIETPNYFFMGVVWIAIHALLLFIGAFILRAPMFLYATSSMANIGGTSSAPVVAAAYQPALAPVGLLMAVFGGIIGTPLGVLVAAICKSIAS